MIFVPVGEYDPEQIGSHFFQKPDVGHDHIHARGGGLTAKQNAAIDDDPRPLVCGTVTVAVQIHANLACAAERQKDEFGAVVR